MCSHCDELQCAGHSVRVVRTSRHSHSQVYACVSLVLHGNDVGMGIGRRYGSFLHRSDLHRTSTDFLVESQNCFRCPVTGTCPAAETFTLGCDTTLYIYKKKLRFLMVPFCNNGDPRWPPLPHSPLSSGYPIGTIGYVFTWILWRRGSVGRGESRSRHVG